MNRLIRTLARSSSETDVWPVLLVFFAVLIPAVFLLWFMSEAMRNERLAGQQKLADAYRGLLSTAQTRLDQAWTAELSELEQLARIAPASAAFARCVRSRALDSVLILDDSGRIIYPNVPSGLESQADAQDPQWAMASQLEYRRTDFLGAARLYDVLARRATNANIVARAWQSQARCLIQAGEKDAAIQLIDRVFAGGQFRQATDVQGRLVAASADLVALELR